MTVLNLTEVEFEVQAIVGELNRWSSSRFEASWSKCQTLTECSSHTIFNMHQHIGGHDNNVEDALC